MSGHSNVIYFADLLVQVHRIPSSIQSRTARCDLRRAWRAQEAIEGMARRQYEKSAY